MALIWPPPHFSVKPNVLERAQLCLHLQATLRSFLGMEFIIISSQLSNILVWLRGPLEKAAMTILPTRRKLSLEPSHSATVWSLLFGMIHKKNKERIFNLTILYLLLDEELKHCQLFLLLGLLKRGFRSLLFAHKDCFSKGVFQPLFFPKTNWTGTAGS